MKAEERLVAMEKENVALRVQAADASQRAEELQEQLSACKVRGSPQCSVSHV